MREMTFRKKTCAECGTEFVPTSGRSKYYPTCVGDVVRRQIGHVIAEKVRKNERK